MFWLPSGRVSTVFVAQLLYPAVFVLVEYAIVVVPSPPVQTEHPAPWTTTWSTTPPGK
jgi:hypothetical protein